MNRMFRMVCAAAAGVMLLAACAEEKETPYTETEQLALRAWMEINRPELLENYQPEGGYYVDVLDPGSSEAQPLGDTAMWIRFTFTGRNLAGDIVLTRNEVDARQVGRYTEFTRYVPYYKFYAGDKNAALIEGTYLALHNTLELGETYAAGKGYPREIQMRYGSKVTLYMPSTVVGSGGVTGDSGFEGQKGYELKSGYPFVVTMQLTDTVRNPLQREGTDVDSFANENGRLKPVRTTKGGLREPVIPPFDPSNPYNDGFAWRNAVDSIPQVYVNLTYKPTTKYTFPRVYQSVYEPYVNFDKLEQDICDTLVNRFGEYNGPYMLTSDSVTLKGTAKIWYIGRFLDGFIFDSNIPGVRRLIYGDGDTEGKVRSYKPENGGMIEAFYYAVPNLRYGQWAGLLTTSTNAYGASGKSGTETTTSNNFDYMNYYNYMNIYYGNNGYYDGYYNNYYNNYLNGYYNNPNNNANTGSETTTTVKTEIPPFTPLLFQIYIEPAEE